MMNLIDRDKLIEELEEYCKNQKWLISENVRNIIKNQPTVNQWIPWIPCKERLPEPYELVLVQNSFGVRLTAIRDENDCWCNFESDNLPCIIAWQPLPKPYEEQKTMWEVE